MAEITNVELSRLAVTRGQLETAILLWFLNKDVVSIHALASAALEVLHDMKAGEPSIIFKHVKKIDRAMHDKANMPQNFFKHADRDKRDRLKFIPEVSEFVMYDAILIFDSTFGYRTPLMTSGFGRASTRTQS